MNNIHLLNAKGVKMEHKIPTFEGSEVYSTAGIILILDPIRNDGIHRDINDICQNIVTHILDVS
jgi:hypothetical protein